MLELGKRIGTKPRERDFRKAFDPWVKLDKQLHRRWSDPIISKLRAKMGKNFRMSPY